MTFREYTMTGTNKSTGNLFSIVITSALICLVTAAIIPGVMGDPIAPVELGTAGNFAVLGSSTVTNTGISQITGDLGLSPGTSVTGFPPGIVIGTIHTANDAASQQAQVDLVTAMNDARSRVPDTIYSTGADLSAQTLTPGVYKFPDTLGLASGDLTLDPGTNHTATAVWIFQVGSTLTTSNGYGTILVNGAQSDNVFWLVGSSATIGSGSAFNGTIMAADSITLNTGATLTGRALANTAAVTLNANTVTSPAASPVVTPPTVTGIIPQTGTAAGGTVVTITGTGFTGATAVTFGSTPAIDVTVFSDSSITATAPVGTAGTVDVTVTAPGGTSAISTADKYTYVDSIEITITGTESQWTLNPAITFTENNVLQVVVNSTANWIVTASDADTSHTNGFMTDWTGSGYVPSTKLANALKVNANEGTYVTLPAGGTIVTGSAGTNQGSYPLGFEQVVTYADPVLHGSDEYQIVVTLTGITQ
jgi:hypothetical protein